MSTISEPERTIQGLSFINCSSIGFFFSVPINAPQSHTLYADPSAVEDNQPSNLLPYQKIL